MRLFGHPLHTQVNHFHVALFPTGVAFDLLSRWLAIPDLGTAALYAWAAGYLGLVASIATGLPDLLRLAPRAVRLGLVHAATGASLLLLFGAAIWARLQGAADVALAAAVVGAATTLVASWLGGQLVFVHGAGRGAAASGDPPPAYTERAAEPGGKGGI